MSHIKNAPLSPAGFRIVDLFAGPGGLDVAADVLGHQVTGIEWDAGACETRNKAGLDTFQGDVREFRAAFFPYAQVLTGGPPCQTFTVAGHGAGRRALDDVLKYIAQLHEAVRAENQEWKEIFRTWRRISGELRRREREAKKLKDRKREVEDLRTAKRRAMRSRLLHLGHSTDVAKKILKELKNPQNLEFQDYELKGLLKEFSDLNDELTKLKDELEELGDERTGLVLQPLWWVIERSKRPGSTPYEAIILEQVPTVMRVWEEYAEVLATLGYKTRTQLMHTEAFGVPQTRRRAVLMARFDPTALANRLHPGHLTEVPESHMRYQPKAGQAETLFSGTSEQSDTGRPRDSWVSMGKALKRAKKIANRLKLDPEVNLRLDPDLNLPDRPDFTVISNYGTGGDPKMRGRRDHDAPSATITGKVSRNRVIRKENGEDLDRFTFAEVGVLQTFPVAYPWHGNDVPQQIGNAVPPRLALHVLRHVLEPELNDEEAQDRMDQVTTALETWKPKKPVEARESKEWKEHPLAGGFLLSLSPEESNF
ncbi:DNA cytosine methyltransferase [Streptomyces sp. NPDC016626]|uniref:DNA cytosine methyltransferase n=1 Tax=Streptomyces sp. NPDC016626 TaxID=3364968 RepID=UPI003701C292